MLSLKSILIHTVSSTRLSSISAVKVTGWGTLKFSAVKVTELGSAVIRPAGSDKNFKTTLPVAGAAPKAGR